jgi:hypothetical protein
MLLSCCLAAGRLHALKQLFLRWEGLLVGGFFLGGLGLLSARVYMRERLGDISRWVRGGVVGVVSRSVGHGKWEP